MSHNFEIRIISRSGSRLSTLEDALLANADLRIKRQLVIDLDEATIADSKHADVVILDLSEHWEKELQLLGKLRRKSDRAPTIVVGIDDDKQMLKSAMKAGARDFFAHPVPETELLNSILQLCQDAKQSEMNGTSISVVMHGKGGAGASFFAANIAHLLSIEGRKASTMLLDLNFLTGELPLYFDLSGGGDLRQAINYLEDMDELALEAFIMHHKSGLHLMASSGDPTDLGWGVNANNLSALVSMLSTKYEQLVIDLPNPTDSVSTPLMAQADRIFVVIQQTLMDLHCTKHLLSMLKTNNVPSNLITVVVNRFDSKNPVRYQDIRTALEGIKIECIPNDYKRVSESINTGVPLGEGWKNASVTRTIRDITYKILGKEKRTTGLLVPFRKLLGSRR
ncbi:MAG: hypothetical protein KDJ38_07725 [Gammaproteobacteria bacterium]|nr:hypothetical protein [Gammaproteobacteria bacterium]